MAFRFIAIVFLLWSAGCTTIVRPPAPPQESATVYLTDERIHSSVLMPVGGGRYVEYAAADWEYGALEKQDFFHVVGALFFSRQGALGRRYLLLNTTATPMAPELRDVKIYPLVVDRARLKLARENLARRFDAGTSPTENHENHFVFVKVDEGYGLFQNCNTLTKRTLRDLNCQVTSRSIYAMYVIEPP